MKRMLVCLSMIALFGSMALAKPKPDQGGDKPRYATPEPGIMAMLGLSLGTIAGGIALRRHAKD
jgi:hypothetical protein